MRRNTGGFVTISTAAAMMVWAFFGNVVLPNILESLAETGTGTVTKPAAEETPSEQAIDPEPEPPKPERLISYEELRENNRRHCGAIKLCYLRAVRRFHLQRSVPSRVNVRLELKNGETIASVASVDPKLASCVQRVVQQYRFAADLGDQSVTFPLILAR